MTGRYEPREVPPVCRPCGGEGIVVAYRGGYGVNPKGVCEECRGTGKESDGK